MVVGEGRALSSPTPFSSRRRRSPDGHSLGLLPPGMADAASTSPSAASSSRVARSNLEVAAAAVGGVKEATHRPPARHHGRGSGWGHACCPQACRRIELDTKFPRRWRPPWIRRRPSFPHLPPPPSSSSAGVLLSRRAAIRRPPHGAASMLFRTAGSRHFPGEGPIRRPERGGEWEPIKILLEGD
jgi:hypothetical protein